MTDSSSVDDPSVVRGFMRIRILLYTFAFLTLTADFQNLDFDCVECEERHFGERDVVVGGTQI